MKCAPSMCRTTGRIVVPPAFAPPSGFAPFPLFFKRGKGREGGASACAVTGVFPALLRRGTVFELPLHPCKSDLQGFRPATEGDFAAGPPALHQTGRSLNGCAGTCLRVGLSECLDYTRPARAVKRWLTPVSIGIIKVCQSHSDRYRNYLVRAKELPLDYPKCHIHLQIDRNALR